jgi:hypothetical protein
MIKAYGQKCVDGGHPLAYRLERLPRRFLILAAGGEHRRGDSNQGYCELNQDEHWNHLMQDTHFNLPLLTSTPINNASY